jgi:acid phosphatase class B
LQGRLASIESHQKEQSGSVHDIVKRMLEYTQMLEQAQGTIHMLQEPRLVKLASLASSSTTTSRRTSLVSFYDDDDSVVSTKETHYNNRKASSSTSSNYIQSPPLGPQSTSSSMFKPQQGLRMLFDNHTGNSIGLGSLAQPRKKH